MFDLDIHTARFAASMLVLGTLLTLRALGDQRQPGPPWMQAGLLYVAGFFLAGVRHGLLAPVVDALMVACLAGSGLYLLQAVRQRLDLPRYPPRFLAGPAAVGALAAIATALNPTLDVAAALAALSLGGATLFAAALWLRAGPSGASAPWGSAPAPALALITHGLWQGIVLVLVLFTASANAELAALASSVSMAAVVLTLLLERLQTVRLEQPVTPMAPLAPTAAPAAAPPVPVTLAPATGVSQQRWLLALENARAGAWQLNLTTNTQTDSAQMAALLGLPHEEREIPLATALNCLHPDDRDHFLLDLQEIRDRSAQVLDREHRLRKADGSYMWVTCLGRVVEDPTNPDHLIISGANTDITDSREAQNKLESAIVEAQGARIAAIKASKAKSTFLANISHEIRTPMNAIMGFSQLLMDDRTLTEKQRENLEIITSSSQHLLSLIEDVLNLSRIESGHLNIQPTGVDPRQFFQELVNLFQKRPLKAGVVFQADIADDWPPALTFDPKCVRQVCFNLLSNAFKFTNSGSVNITAHLERERGGRLHMVIEVVDTGMGISEEDQRTIFDAFVQTSQGANFDGYGLGLSICKSLVTQMGGKIEVHSQLNEGSRFIVTLPVTPAEKIQPVPSPYAELPTRPLSNKPLTLLIVDDITSNRQLLMRLLENSGYQILEAANAKSALEMMESAKPDLVMMDIRMPVMNGDDAIRKIRKQPGLSSIPVIAITANAIEGERERLLEMGAAAFLTKPFTRTEVFQTITRVLHAVHKQEEPPAPIKREAPPKPQVSVPAAAVATATAPAILIVDDNRANLQLLTSQLRHLGLTADIAHDGEEGYKRFLSKPYDLIFSDCHMPVLDGFELTSRIRHFETEGGSERRTVIIAITGSPEEFRTKCFECGMDEVIGKPLLLNTLTRSLEKFKILQRA